jgi:hypothetical protein
MSSIALEQRFWRLALLPQPYLVLCGLVLTLVLGGCSKPAQMVDIRKLKELKDWQAVALSDMLNKPADAVCVVRPYLTEVYEDVPFRDQINAHLKTTKYQTNESEWAFAFVHGDSVTVQKFGGYGDRLGLGNGHPIVPRTFKAAECAKVDRARILKVPGPAVILGEDR